MLIKKKRGLGKGFWNGPGGKIDNGETAKTCVIRELNEEIGVKPINPKCGGTLKFYFGKKSYPDWLVYVFTSNDYQGQIKETDEAFPKWFNKNRLPFDKMWEDDQYWLPLIIDGKSIAGEFIFSADMESLLNYSVVEQECKY